MGGFRQAGPAGLPVQQSNGLPPVHNAVQEDEDEPGSPSNQINQQPTEQHAVRIHNDPEHEPGYHGVNQADQHHIDVEFVPHHEQRAHDYNYPTINQTIEQPINQSVQQPNYDQSINQAANQSANQPKAVNLRDIRAQYGAPPANNQSNNKGFFGRKQSNGQPAAVNQQANQSKHEQGIPMVPIAQANGHAANPNIHTLNHNHHNHAHQPVHQPANRSRRGSRARRKVSHERAHDPNVNGAMPYPASMFSRTRRAIIPNFRLLSMTNLILLACLVMIIIELVLGETMYGAAFDSSNPMGGPSVKTLYRLGGKWEPAIHDGEGWRLVSAIFLHSGLLHFAMNAITLVVIGYTAEQRFTWPIYLIIFVASGILGNLWSCVTYASSVGVGASGAIFGVIGAQLAHLVYNFSLIENAFAELTMLVIVAVVGICLGFISQVSANMDTYAHLGGFLAGIALGFTITPFPRKRHIVIEGAVRIAGLLGTVCLFLIFSLLLFLNPQRGPDNVTNL